MNNFLSTLDLAWSLLGLSLITIIGWVVQGFINHRFGRRLALHTQAQKARDTLIEQQMQTAPGLVELRIDAVKQVWDSFCQIKSNPPSFLQHAMDLMTLEERAKSIVNQKFISTAQKTSIDVEKIAEWMKSTEVEHLRPFVEGRGYLVWVVHRAVVARNAYLIGKSIENKEYIHWPKDKTTLRLLELCLEPKELASLDKVEFRQLAKFSEIMETKLLASLNRSLSGQTEEDISQISEALAKAEQLRMT